MTSTDSVLFLILRKLHHGKSIYITKFAILTIFRYTVALNTFCIRVYMHTMALSTFTLLYDHQHHPCPGHFYLPRLKPHPSSNCPVPSSWQSPVAFLSLSLAALGTTYKWIIQYLPFHERLTYFTPHNVLKFHPCCSICQNSLLLKVE